MNKRQRKKRMGKILLQEMIRPYHAIFSSGRPLTMKDIQKGIDKMKRISWQIGGLNYLKKGVE